MVRLTSLEGGVKEGELVKMINVRGERRAEVSFELVPEAPGIRFMPSRATVSIESGGETEDCEFKFIAPDFPSEPDLLTEHEIWLEVSQSRRAMQTLKIVMVVR